MTNHKTFQGFPKEGITFLQKLERNNNRDWFQDNKQTFKSSLEQPAKTFLEDMSYRLVSLSGSPMTGKIFRIYRDVRFSKDKTPYNPHIRMSFMRETKQKDCGEQPMFCFSLEPNKLTLGIGCFEFSKKIQTLSKKFTEIYIKCTRNS